MACLRFPLSSLRGPKETVESFVARHPDAWLVWESATFRVPPKTAMLTAKLDAYVPKSQPSDPPAFELGQPVQPLVLGRDAASDVAINDGTVSAKHLEFSFSAGAWKVRVLEGREAKLDGVAVSPEGTVLRSGQRLDVGGVQLTFLSSAGLHARLHSVAAT